MNKVDEALEEVKELINSLSAVGRMSPAEAKEFFSELADDCQIRADALDDD